MSRPCRSFEMTLPDEEATAALGRALGSVLGAGHCVLLEGGLGAGKTHLARALIQSRLAAPEDVPSPTFTLVQIYETGGPEIWHADLYRLSGPDEAIELGLDAAFESAICLVEWPDRLGDMTPPDALTLALASESAQGRRATFRWSAGDWAERLAGLT